MPACICCVHEGLCGKCTDIEAANCCYEMFHIASLCGRGMCAKFSFPFAVIFGFGRRHCLVLYTLFGPAYAVYIMGCAVNVLMLERLTAVTK